MKLEHMRMTHVYIISSLSIDKKINKFLKSVVSCERMNERKHSFSYKRFFSIFFYLKNNSALENVLVNR